MFKVAFVGSRGFRNLELVRAKVRQLNPGTVVVSGGAQGVDQTAEHEARARGLPVEIILPDYQRHGRIAPLHRNRAIVEAANHVCAFWDGLSGGTANALAWAVVLGKDAVVFGEDGVPLGDAK